MKKLVVLILSVFSFLAVGSAQRVALKTNLAYAATATPNLALEVGLSRKTTLDLYGGFNPFTFKDNMKWKHWLVQPELRYWFCEKFNGTFIGLHGHGGQVNIGNVNLPQFGYFLNNQKFSSLKKHRFEGWFVGAGISIGHQWILGNHWNIEASVGAGYVYTRYDKFDCVKCGKRLESDKEAHYFGPTRATLSLVYVIR